MFFWKQNPQKNSIELLRKENGGATKAACHKFATQCVKQIYAAHAELT